ncbi:MAG: outer membrane lipoprotein-sorting protein [Spirochaetaceae bacterium]|jgi:outer membrane lipoprotein-sorting protein|nr:outer membrane lipoprotein-sorting protein [Spirochaetaceae bacterium]GMO16876.1 MAG: outer membrane lipoprotein-sorting protein [Termitinemataceae bacterium]
MKRFFKPCLFLIAAVLVAASPDEELLVKVDSLASYTDSDFSAVYEIVQTRPGQSETSTVAGVYRRDAKEQYVIIILEPSISKGQGYLKEGNTLWFYDPESKSFNSTSSRERFQNSNASNSDFTRSTFSLDYTISSGSNEVYGPNKCRVLELRAKASAKSVSYPKVKIWVSADGLVRKTEDYSLSGQHLRTTEIPAYYRIGPRFVPKAIRITDKLRGQTVAGKFVSEQTIISVREPRFDKLRDTIFTKAYLSSISRRHT